MIVLFEIARKGKRSPIERFDIKNDDCIKMSTIELFRVQLQKKFKRAVTIHLIDDKIDD